MKASHRSSVLGIALLMLFIPGPDALATKKVPPPNEKEIAGVWFGFDRDMLVFCRLELGQGGKGFFSTAFVDNPARLYRIDKWAFDAFSIKMVLTPIDREAESIYLRGSADQSLMVLEMGGIGRKWKRQLKLFNERNFSSKSKRTEDRIGAYREEEKRKPSK